VLNGEQARRLLDSRRIGDLESLCSEVAAWVADRNKNQAKADWPFTTEDA